MSKIVGMNGEPHERDGDIVAEAIAVDDAGEPIPLEWPGACQGCGAPVPRELIEIDPEGKKPPLHRVRKNRHDLVGVLCGPVFTKWLVHAVYVLQAPNGGFQFVRRREVIPCPPEAANSIEKLEAAMQASVVVPEGEAPPLVTLLSFQLLGNA